MAIIHYLDKKIPTPALFPKSPEDLALCIQLCEMIGSGIQPLQNIGVLSHLTKEFSISPEQKNDWIVHWISTGFDALEKILQKSSGTYCIGEAITAADLFLIPQIYNAKRFHVKMDNFSNICKIESQLPSTRSFQKGLSGKFSRRPSVKNEKF